MLTYLRALDKLDAFLAERGMPRTLTAIRREHLDAFFAALAERDVDEGTEHGPV